MEIPGTIDGYSVTSIGDEAFYYCKSLASVTIPDSVTSIGYDAFLSCTSLESVTIPDSVTSIGDIFMTIGVIIAEFNPFHNGHKYCIEKLRESGCTHIICIMSGCFVQRGEPSCIISYDRAEAAVKNGADLIIELPAPYALSSAEKFAEGAISIAEDMGIVDKIGFGVESNENFHKIFRQISDTLKGNYDIILSCMKSGISYPVAVQKIIEEKNGIEIANELKSGNNILALNYLSALEKYNSNIESVFIKRKGAIHDSEESSGKFASASFIRKIISENNSNFPEILRNYIPKEMLDILLFNLKNKTLVSIDKLEKVLLYKIRTSTLDDWKNLPDIGNQGLAERFYSNRNAASLEEFLFSVKTKRYPMARIKRLLFNLAIGIDKKAIQTKIPYGRILAFNKKGCEILKIAKEKSKIPLDTSLARLSKISDNARYFANIEANANALYGLGADSIARADLAYSRKIVVIS